MPLNLSWYQFKLASYNFRILIVNPMGNSRKISEKYSEKDMKRESKWCTTKNQTQKKEILEEMKNMRDKIYIENKQQNGRSKFFLISNSFTCKWNRQLSKKIYSHSMHEKMLVFINY